MQSQAPNYIQIPTQVAHHTVNVNNQLTDCYLLLAELAEQAL